MIKTLEIQVDVPDGATHYSYPLDFSDEMFEFWKIDQFGKLYQCARYWDSHLEKWIPFWDDYPEQYTDLKIKQIKPIVEVKND